MLGHRHPNPQQKIRAYGFPHRFVDHPTKAHAIIKTTAIFIFALVGCR